MKVYKDGKYVKMIPSRYEPILDSVLDLVETDKKRLSPDERKFLELCLLRHNLKENDKLVFELVKDCEFEKCTKITRRGDSNQYGIVSNEYRAKFKGCPEIRIASESALILNKGEFTKHTKIA